MCIRVCGHPHRHQSYVKAAGFNRGSMWSVVQVLENGGTAGFVDSPEVMEGQSPSLQVCLKSRLKDNQVTVGQVHVTASVGYVWTAPALVCLFGCLQEMSSLHISCLLNHLVEDASAILKQGIGLIVRVDLTSV